MFVQNGFRRDEPLIYVSVDDAIPESGSNPHDGFQNRDL